MGRSRALWRVLPTVGDADKEHVRRGRTTLRRWSGAQPSACRPASFERYNDASGHLDFITQFVDPVQPVRMIVRAAPRHIQHARRRGQREDDRRSFEQRDGFRGLERNGHLPEIEALFPQLHGNQLEQVSGKLDANNLKNSGGSPTRESSSLHGTRPRTHRNRRSDAAVIVRAVAHRPRVHAPRGTRRDEWQPRPASGGRGTPP